MNRRTFIQISSALAVGNSLLSGCQQAERVPGKILGQHASRGHLLRDRKWEPVQPDEKKEIVIIGAGISGLSAARHLQQSGWKDLLVLDLAETAGGNAIAGSNSLSAYPWGAHYIPIPNNSLEEYLVFLSICGVITGSDARGLPIYNEAYLCFEPEERLYINGRWQEGLIPTFGLAEDDQQEIKKFLQIMNEYRYKQSAEGREYFAIPVDWSVADEEMRQLDQTTMEKWMREKGFSSEALHRYVNYCCRDDFGTPHHLISAWAGIHYFASRKGKGANAEHEDVLTWPEGNAFLARQLSKGLEDRIRTNTLVTGIHLQEEGLHINYLDARNQPHAIAAKQCILAVPQFVAARLLQDEKRLEQVKSLQYSPWMVANLRVKKMEERSGAPLSWDNVLHESRSLGYVEATHQLLNQSDLYRNLTYYLPLTEKDPTTERKAAYDRSHADWVQLVKDDLRIVHPDIDRAIQEMDVLLWGHAMVQPRPGYISGTLRKELSASLHNRIHFAHTDLSGISIFEEGFYQGIGAARKLMDAIQS